VYMREGTTSRLMEVDRPYDDFYDFYSVSAEYFGYTLVFIIHLPNTTEIRQNYGDTHVYQLEQLFFSSCFESLCS
jgi:hypothetical protein